MFDDQEKLIFEYSIGRVRGEDGKFKDKRAFGDPLAIWNRMIKLLDGDAEGAHDKLKIVRDLDPQTGELLEETPGHQLLRVEAEERFLQAIRKAFGMMDFNWETGEGASDHLCWDAYNSYGRWIKGEGRRVGD